MRLDERGGHGACTSSETSRERAEWVSAPTEIESTPVSAMARTFSSVTPPEASSSARPATSATARAGSAGRHVVEQDPLDAERERLLDLLERVGLDLERKRTAARRRRTASATPPARRRWLSLTSTAS